MSSSEAVNKKSGGITLTFSKFSSTKKLQKSSIAEIKDAFNDEVDFVSGFEDKKVQGSKIIDEPKEYVIPCIKKNVWQKTNQDKKPANSKGENPSNSLEDLAAKEIIADANRQNEEWNERGVEDTGAAIPLLFQNQIPSGYETDDRLDVSLRPNEPEDTEYDSVPIEHFGKAMLRGMGWKDGEGIGKNKKLVNPTDVVIRPKGMGLGADKSAVKQLNHNKGGHQKKDSDDSPLVLKTGSHCVVEKGSSKGLYGTVVGVDEDNARVLVKLSINSNTITVSQYTLRLVHKKEYDKYHKYLNKVKVDEYKLEEEKKKEKELEMSKKESSSRSGEKRAHASYDNGNSHRHKKHKSDHQRSTNGSSSIWLRPQIRVRIIDKSYKKGKYYKSKVVVEDILSKENCICKTDEGRLLEEISQRMLETVIPKDSPGFVMILSGKYKGQVGEVLKKDKSKCEATLQLVGEQDTIIKMDYDSISEYVGNVSEHY
ncbi:G-patch domain and KOW motifs-containing protein-like [Octopus vulgaris]|uniref:G-patch domain and KOW motifs-containing protein-like n=2 Tax=Octopus TaxID=6643 RepID=A0AA36FNF7_OCTVU|nr:G-patch domain and KOW motifs-containing protein [Octopus sinensis]CAI9740198.1 G-patch domain and KOW motifs-containing protein-like [Octopus vulgaris]